MQIVGLSSTRVCRMCKHEKPLEDFAKSKRYKHGVSTRCLECQRAYQREFMRRHPEYERNWKNRNPESYRRKVRKHHLKLMFGMTPDDYQRMLDAQGGVCAICHQPETAPRYKNLAIDHDHSTGQVRALLCHRCNTSIGSMDESPELLESAARYLRKWRLKVA